MNTERRYWKKLMEWAAVKVHEAARNDIQRIQNGPASDQERLLFHDGTLMLHELNLSPEQLEVLYKWRVMLGKNILAWFLAVLEQPPILSGGIERLTIVNAMNSYSVDNSDNGETLDGDLIDGFLTYDDRQIQKKNDEDKRT